MFGFANFEYERSFLSHNSKDLKENVPIGTQFYFRDPKEVKKMVSPIIRQDFRINQKNKREQKCELVYQSGVELSENNFVGKMQYIKHYNGNSVLILGYKGINSVLSKAVESDQ